MRLAADKSFAAADGRQVGERRVQTMFATIDLMAQIVLLLFSESCRRCRVDLEKQLLRIQLFRLAFVLIKSLATRSEKFPNF